MAKSKKQIVTPQLNLKGDDFTHVVPDDLKMEIIIHWKGKNAPAPDVLNPVHAFAKVNGEFKVINRTNQDIVYAYNLKEVKAVYIIPTE